MPKCDFNKALWNAASAVFVPNCRRGSNFKFWEKTPQVHLIIIRE